MGHLVMKRQQFRFHVLEESFCFICARHLGFVNVNIFLRKPEWKYPILSCGSQSRYHLTSLDKVNPSIGTLLFDFPDFL